MTAPLRYHRLKTWPKHFEAMWLGQKHFELRYNDRDFKTGDVLVLIEWIPDLDYNSTKGGHPTGRVLIATVTYILRDTEEQPEFVPDGWVVMSLVVWSHEEVI